MSSVVKGRGFFQPLWTHETAASSNKCQSHDVFEFQFSLHNDLFFSSLFLYLKERNKSIFNVHRLMHCFRKKGKIQQHTQCLHASLFPQWFYSGTVGPILILPIVLQYYTLQPRPGFVRP